MRRIVLGAGPVGLIAAYLLRASCVGEVVGGARKLRSLSPTYLWATPGVDALIHSLGFAVKRCRVRFGWLTPAGIMDVPTPEDRARYVARSRGVSLGKASYASSGRRGNLLTYDLSVEDLVAALRERVTVHRGTVERVVVGTGEIAVLMFEGRIYLRDSVVNTLPAPVWNGLLQRRIRTPLEAGCKTFVSSEVAWDLRLVEESMLGLARRRYLYVSDPEVPFDRVMLRDGHTYVYEFNKSMIPASFLREVDGRIEYSHCGQVTGDVLPEGEFGGRVVHLGRMARWDHSIRLHDVVDRVLAMREEVPRVD